MLKAVPIEAALATLSLRSPSPPVHDIIKLIGEGARGQVFEATIEANGQICALKIIKIGKWSSKKDAEHEATILKELQHENIVIYYDSWMSNDSFYIAMEYFRGVKLTIAIKDGMSSEHCRMVIRQLLQVANHLHHKAIAHGDFYGDNILINGEGRLIMIDFGGAQRLEPAAYSDELQTSVYTGYSANLVKLDIGNIREIVLKIVRQVSDDDNHPVEGFAPQLHDMLESVLNEDLQNPKKPETSEPKLDSKGQYVHESLESFLSSISESAMKLSMAWAVTEMVLEDLLRVFLFVLVCVILIIYTNAKFSLDVLLQIILATIEFQAAHWELYKLISRVTWQT